MATDLSRRNLLLSGGSVAAAPLLIGEAAAQAPAMPGAPAAGGAAAVRPPWEFFTEPEAALITAAVDRLIPADDAFAGAVGAGVPTFIDRQLAGSYGAGHRLYRQGPFAEGTPEQGYQMPLTPAELYRLGLAAFGAWARQGYGGAFETLDGRLQDAALKKLESGEAGFNELPSAVFFETLLANTVEGFFSDPMHGGNRDMVGWRMVGFPGPYAGYAELVGRHNLRFTREPRGIAQSVLEHAHHPAPRAQR